MNKIEKNKNCKSCKYLKSEHDELGCHMYDYCYKITSKVGGYDYKEGFVYIDEPHEFFCSEFEYKNKRY